MLPQRDPRKNMKNIQDSTVLSKFLLMCSDSGFSCIERPGNSSTDDGSVCYKPVAHATRQHADFSYIKFISELCLFFTNSAYNKRRAVRVIILAWTCRENVAIFSFNSDILMAVSSNGQVHKSSCCHVSVHPFEMYRPQVIKDESFVVEYFNIAPHSSMQRIWSAVYFYKDCDFKTLKLCSCVPATLRRVSAKR